MKTYQVKKNDELFKEISNLAARIGGLGAIIQKDRELTDKEAKDFFDRCENNLQDLNQWCVKTANFIDGCNKDLYDDAKPDTPENK